MSLQRSLLGVILALACLAGTSSPQIKCQSEHDRLRGLLNELRQLEGLPPLASSEGPARPGLHGPLGPDPMVTPSAYDASAVAEWHKIHDAEVAQLKARLAGPACAPTSPSPDSQPHPYDLVYNEVDDTGIPLFPVWKSSVTAPYYSAPDPAQCGNGDPWTAPCTSQPTEINNNTGLCPVGKLGGHANWIPATYVGRITWESHSLESQDDDYNFDLLPLIPQTPTPWITSTDTAASGLHLEFSSDETIDHFHTPWWSSFHAAVDDDDRRSMDNPFGTPRREMVSGSSKALEMVRGTYAIVSGLMGLDCAHSCGAEIHPVWALAMHVQDDPNNDVWTFFARNTGNEGYCGSKSEWLNTQHFTFRLPWRPGATDLQVVGQDFRWKSASSPGGTIDPRFDEKAVLITLNLAPPSQGDRVNGELHLKWTGDPKPYLLPASIATEVRVQEREDDAEAKAAVAFHNLTAAQRTVAAKKLPRRDASVDAKPGSLTRSRAAAPAPNPPRVTSVADTRGLARAKQRSEALRAARSMKTPKNPG